MLPLQEKKRLKSKLACRSVIFGPYIPTEEIGFVYNSWSEKNEV